MKHLFLLLASFLFFACMADGQIISTIAGDSLQGYNGDSIEATIAELYQPVNVTLDRFGNVFIADAGNNRIRKVSNSGIISTIAGTGVAGYNGDEIAATLAQLYKPIGLFVDTIGNIYIGDDYNQRIRKINTLGIISTIAGNGINGYNGDNILATDAELNDPHGVTVDNNGNVYIADLNNNRIRKINNSGIITTIAGNNIAGYSGDGEYATNASLNLPYDITMDITGNIYFTEWNNNCIREINNSGIIATIAGKGIEGYSGDNGDATNAELNHPGGIAIDCIGNIYIGDVTNNCIRKINSYGIITTIAGDGAAGFNGDGEIATLAKLSGPVGVAFDMSCNLYIADWGNDRIRYVNSTVFLNSMNKTQNEIAIYPNPSNGIFYVKLLSDINVLIPISITDVLGNKVLEVDLFTNQISTIKIDVPAGIYFLSATYFGERWYDKIIVN